MRQNIGLKNLFGVVLLITIVFWGAPAVYAGPTLEANEAFNLFQYNYPGTWDVLWDEATGYARFVSGSVIEPKSIPASDEEFILSAHNLLKEYQLLFGVNPEQLLSKAVNRSPMAKVGLIDKAGVEFVQKVNGLSVYSASLIVLFLPDGRITAIDSQTLPIPDDFNVQPNISAIDAQTLAKKELSRTFMVSIDETSDGTLVIYPLKEKSGRKIPRLAWMITVGSKEKQNGLPIRWMYVVAADTVSPELLDKWTLVHQGDISGTIQGWATPGLGPDADYNPEQIFPTEDDYVDASSGQQTTTDENGSFLFKDHDTTFVSAKLAGPWVHVYDLGGSDEEVSGWFEPGVPGTLTFNPSQIENAAAEVNAAKWVNDFRDYILLIDPSYNLMNFQVLSWVNDYDTCNAYYYGAGIVFFQSGGGCVNTAYSTVITHEEGHWANDEAGSGNGPDGFGEGAADTWALYVTNTMNGNTDDPLLGRDFYGPWTYVRTGQNTRAFCGDSNPGCYGEVHDDGEVLMGALWKVRDWFKYLSGPNTGNAVANSLLVSWFKQYNQSEIKSVIETQWLTLDDNDGTLDNGSPHFCEIDLGFREQSFPGVAKPPKFAGVYWNSIDWPDGSCEHPFLTVSDALQTVGTPGEIHIVGGHTYDEPTPLTITKTVTLRAKAGVVTIK